MSRARYSQHFEDWLSSFEFDESESESESEGEEEGDFIAEEPIRGRLERFIARCLPSAFFEGINTPLFKDCTSVILLDKRCIFTGLSVELLAYKSDNKMLFIHLESNNISHSLFDVSLIVSTPAFFISRLQNSSLGGFSHIAPGKHPALCSMVFICRISLLEDGITISSRGLEPRLRKKGIVSRLTKNFFKNCLDNLGQLSVSSRPVHIATAILFATSSAHERQLIKQFRAGKKGLAGDVEQPMLAIYQYLEQKLRPQEASAKKRNCSIFRSSAKSPDSMTATAENPEASSGVLPAEKKMCKDPGDRSSLLVM